MPVLFWAISVQTHEAVCPSIQATDPPLSSRKFSPSRTEEAGGKGDGGEAATAGMSEVLGEVQLINGWGGGLCSGVGGLNSTL